ncbi:symmetrical bis(5'-nucleosyl)-tetraphosphatase [Nitrincola tapanii]|uniref:Bis(5'-nucleosyl)-tetraphosphatase, symmetrical n=1 Tax=Nitrincola tapanii TaxID=1708751 RepID=A0A5A9VZ96_9GAMM|nr:symmetrical bis(5'-nucleosyl)-tetraphosphatase [Nitrincola tapanii]KAA0873554.1 symmetrical bis(5'-nucleosyl)-tetraphosphatase [Nitrincola tapanii]
MATYAIGDVQGCYDELLRLLDQVGFSDSDRLWFAGDLVNRGHQSLQVLRFVKQLGTQAESVLGNHDLHLLALHFGATRDKRNTTLQPILHAPDRDELMNWLRQRPMLIDDEALGYVLTHAGIPPIWSLDKAKKRAQELEQVLRGRQAAEFFRHMYGNKPDQWHKNLEGWARLRVITNYFTRMRFITATGRLEFAGNGGPEEAPEGFKPWYAIKRSTPMPRTQLFGHWAALMGQADLPGCIALDTGCVWGNRLTALRLEDQTLFDCGCEAYRQELTEV